MLSNTTPPETDHQYQEYFKELQAILKFAPIGIYQADTNGQFTLANAEMAWMLGYESPQALIDNMNDIASRMFADEKSAEMFFFELFETEQVKAFRCQLRRKNASPFWANSYAKLHFDKKGRPDGFYGFSMDITHTIRMEKRLKEANDKLQKIASLDGLTRIANRRKFDEYLACEWQRAYREQQPIALILCDIDYFKPYNDNYGHQAGDDTLQQVARVLKKQCRRPADLMARYGGEEFVAVLPDTDQNGAMKVGENLRKAIQSLNIPHAHSQTAPFVTISAGISCAVPDHTTSPETMIKMADAALYQAKETGRNRICSNTGEVI